ncbi:MAG TPA: hypothetical protein VNE63_00785 [Candidatus Acidoferrales bacterium]|nr:hypothetical protein [Terriglobia bacterium]HVB54954.1 hypothetical protein [Candidatus Acidoferrales bacterium]
MPRFFAEYLLEEIFGVAIQKTHQTRWPAGKGMVAESAFDLD